MGRLTRGSRCRQSTPRIYSNDREDRRFVSGAFTFRQRLISVGAIELIQERLAKYPHVRYDVAGSSITVRSAEPSGFDVSLCGSETEWIVSFDGWHEHFSSEKEALDCFAFGLSDRCRLKVTRRGRFPYRWVVESLSEDGWIPDSETGLLFFPFWLPRRVEYRQNSLLTDV